MSTRLEREWERQRRALLRAERDIERQITLAHKRMHKRVADDLVRLQDAIRKAERSGVPVKDSWLRRQERFQSLLDDIERETWAYGREVSEMIAEGQRGSVSAVSSHQWNLVEATLLPAPQQAIATIESQFARFDARAVAKYVGWASDGSPLADLLTEISRTTRMKASDTLLSGITRGQNPRQVAYALQKVTDVPLSRALTISRTEVLRSYRLATTESLVENQELVNGWTWKASLDDRTCSACWFMDGTDHAASDLMDAHINCRCTQLPLVKPWKDLGFDIPDRRPLRIPGAQQFENLPDATKRKILGPGKYDAYKSGDVTLKDLAQHDHDPRWGGQWRERSLKEARAAA